MSSNARPTSVESPLAAQAPTKLVIASRESRLAMWQAEYVRAALQKYYPACDVSILGMTTRGDQILDRSLAKVGGKGLFVKELEVALAEGRADLAVHSLKDVPMELPPGFALSAILEREDPRDAFVSNDYADLAALPAGAVVGTSSLRREASLRARFPHLVIQRCAAISTHGCPSSTAAITRPSSSRPPGSSGWGCPSASAPSSRPKRPCRRRGRARSASRAASIATTCRPGSRRCITRPRRWP